MQIIWMFFAKPEEIQSAKQKSKALNLPKEDADRFEFPNSSTNEELTDVFSKISKLRPEWTFLDTTFTYLGNGAETHLGDFSGGDHQFFVDVPTVKATNAIFNDPEFQSIKSKVVFDVANKPGYKGSNGFLSDDGKLITRPVSIADIEAALNLDIERVKKIYSRAAASNFAVIIDVSY